MRKASKGVVAASAGAVLLLGGGGTLAYWTDSDAVTGDDFDAGQLRLVTDATNTGCGPWMLSDDEGTLAYDSATMKIVPGDVLTRDCSFTVKAEGTHLRASVGIGDATFTPGDAPDNDTAFGGMLTGDVTDLEVNGVAVTELTQAHDEGSLTVGVTVTFDWAAGNGTQDISTVLGNLAIVTTQEHAPHAP